MINQNNRTHAWLTPEIYRAAYADSIRSQETAAMEIKYIEEIQSHGVFATGTIKKGAFLGEFGGILRLEDPKTDGDNSYLLATEFSYYKRSLVIDPLHAGGALRFLNHSSFPTESPKGIKRLICQSHHRRSSGVFCYRHPGYPTRRANFV